MSARFEVLDWQATPMGDISLRRRREPTLDVDVFEVKLGDEYLMSSLFTVAEVELARLGLARARGTGLDVLVGGLGLGYTARTALEDPRVRSLAVVEALGEVIGWHKRDLLPDTVGLAADPRCQIVQGDFFALVAAGSAFGEGVPASFDAVLLDIDHTPRHVLHPSHAGFYTVEGLEQLSGHLGPGGVFALWSDDPPDEPFIVTLQQVLDDVQAHVVPFANPLTGGESSNTVYVARRR
jgi:spermidine synthase